MLLIYFFKKNVFNRNVRLSKERHNQLFLSAALRNALETLILFYQKITNVREQSGGILCSENLFSFGFLRGLEAFYLEHKEGT